MRWRRFGTPRDGGVELQVREETATAVSLRWRVGGTPSQRTKRENGGRVIEEDRRRGAMRPPFFGNSLVAALYITRCRSSSTGSSDWNAQGRTAIGRARKG
ncbi:hypothetical protein E2562_004988 [Oryza meyeriana var. granulata]|uniref:Uncharacterized protein n=1 Tax=Oryza meyeriana var. granulata TaxID=110450 RepID=A0A6G1C4P3_9ORYZ|nr:hypothetical protein E2562_004988 [Oryza meyeriana var. granulata]